ncbi:MAG: cytochrome c peroxidase [Thermoanaerobaculia bacterium]
MSGALLVVHAGSNDLSIFPAAGGFAVAHLELGANPRRLALDSSGSRAYVNNALDGTLSVVDVNTPRIVDTITVTSIPLPPDVLLGKRLFHSSANPAIARDRWVACASCHPDGGSDGRTWFFPDGPRNTPTLLGVAETLPLDWSGDLDELQEVEDTIRRIQGVTGLAERAFTRVRRDPSRSLPARRRPDDVIMSPSVLKRTGDPVPMVYPIQIGSISKFRVRRGRKKAGFRYSSVEVAAVAGRDQRVIR